MKPNPHKPEPGNDVSTTPKKTPRAPKKSTKASMVVNPTIYDVAKLAKVSTATVSAVINGRASVSEGACRVVNAAMIELGYSPAPRGQRPGPRAATARGRRTKRIAFLSPVVSRKMLQAPVYLDVQHGVEQELAAAGYTMVLRHVHETDLPNPLFPGRVDGVVLLGAPLSARLRSQLQALPCVRVMGSVDPAETWDHVTYDNDAVGRLAAEHLAGRGHRQVACVAATGAAPPFIGRRSEVFALRAAELGLACGTVGPFQLTLLQEDLHDVDMAAIGRLATALLALAPRPTALFVPMDMWTVALQGELQRRGVRLGPGGMELVSCNNERILLAGLHPCPASIDIQAQRIGERGAAQLLWRLEHSAESRLVQMLEPQFPTLRGVLPLPFGSATDVPGSNAR